MQTKTEPKISALLNNCPLYALTPEIKSEISRLARDPTNRNAYTVNYEVLKNKFASFYGFTPKQDFSWELFASILERYNAFDTQLILGPVLRLMLKEKVYTLNEEAHFLVEGKIDIGQYIPAEIRNKLRHVDSVAYFTALIDLLSEIDPASGRYFSLDIDSLAYFIAKPLGIQLTASMFFNEEPLIMDSDKNHLDVPLAHVMLFHNGLDGAEQGGHWERGLHPSEELESDTQLWTLGEDLLKDPNAQHTFGFYLLQRHVRITAQSILTKSPLMGEFEKLSRCIREMADFINSYNQNIGSVERLKDGSIKTKYTDLDTLKCLTSFEEYLKHHAKTEILHYDQILLSPVAVKQRSSSAKGTAPLIELASPPPNRIEILPPLVLPVRFKAEFDRVLEALLLKAKEIESKLDDDEYYLVGVVIVTLHTELTCASRAYFEGSHEIDDFNLFKGACKAAISKASPVLSNYNTKEYFEVFTLWVNAVWEAFVNLFTPTNPEELAKPLKTSSIFFKKDSLDKVQALDEAITNCHPEMQGPVLN